ncbi:glutathione peroxidase [Verrucomicrobiales bacterium]|nr:glutathione peroxidase [bacterium]MDB4617498.1 glutathione peroxidase [Verrucomicrobiales bacterium]MDC0314441.1 glutathione peroxidase [bacterium]MDC0322627.1 glutathione peroxidase [Verrucomicrobiales bacterium]
MSLRILPLPLVILLALFSSAFAEEKPLTSVHDFTVKNIAGEEVKLADYKGKILLIVNVASECGVTAQYETLQALYEVLKDRDFVVMGFPSNEFGGQEPGTNEEIATFCKTEYAVTFPMFSKIETNGKKQAPLFKYLTTAKNPDKDGAVGWNFEKFLVGKDGKLIRRFGSSDEPDGPEIIAAIKVALADK